MLKLLRERVYCWRSDFFAVGANSFANEYAPTEIQGLPPHPAFSSSADSLK